MKDYLYENGFENDIIYNSTEGYILFKRLKNKLSKKYSRIEIISADKIENALRGREFSTGFFEEATTIDQKVIEGVFFESVKRTRQPNVPHHVLLSTNPDLVSHILYELLYSKQGQYNTEQRLYNTFIEAGFTHEEAWKESRIHVRQMGFLNGYNRNDREAQARVLSEPPRRRKMFYYGEWGLLEGQAFPIEEGKHIIKIDTEQLDKFYISFDYGMTPDPMVYLLMAIRNGSVYVIDEIVLYDIPVNRHEPYIQAWLDKYTIVGYTGDYSSGSGDVRALLNSMRLTYYMTVKKRGLGWTTMNDLIDLNRFYVDISCEKTVKSLHSMVWVIANRKIDCEGDFDDPADTIRYFTMTPMIYRQLGLRRRIEDE
jgi:hypothetical protein